MGIADWQRRFFAGEAVWAVLCEENVGNFYTTREAAQIEIDYLKSIGRERGHRVQKIHLHTPELARERWLDKFDEPATTSHVETETKR